MRDVNKSAQVSANTPYLGQHLVEMKIFISLWLSQMKK